MTPYDYQTQPFAKVLDLLLRALGDTKGTVYKLDQKFDIQTYAQVMVTYVENRKPSRVLSILNLFKSKSIDFSKYYFSKISFKFLHWFVAQAENIKLEIPPKIRVTSQIDKGKSTEFTIYSDQLLYSYIFNERYEDAIKYLCKNSNYFSDYSRETPFIHCFFKKVLEYYLKIKKESPDSILEHHSQAQILKSYITGFLIRSSIIGDFKIFKELNFDDLIYGVNPVLSSSTLTTILFNALNSNMDIMGHILKYTSYPLKKDDFKIMLKEDSLAFKKLQRLFK
ncbi:hypothetical protein DICPUDRAFT_160190 [Dictyostelium purpureum]|uniref:Uncharacterized protein n=1 Tax=Dictyostelium purpureum TaxID=5786 RepID=F1A5W1_DICPU|nr:uncharacterized protein DICPUDRAFT_160190 [Dictyostelium purpureum]EGC28419.1 hypothetical protein DICPUDRAFT_160190 [Dictyostelium purpureum]|eukprot:XP_003295055.1 hypothetical protein DICPUDRAFT_160190 [Dictyostelium purpureum]